jgi:hypothetical protein
MDESKESEVGRKEISVYALHSSFNHKKQIFKQSKICGRQLHNHNTFP